MAKNLQTLFSPFDANVQIEKCANTYYMIAMTPRSGSSYLSDLLSNTKLVGRPGEFLPYEHIEIALNNLGKKHPSIQEHFTWVVNQTKTNGIFGQKASYYQFRPFLNWNGTNVFDVLFPNTRYIYLIRRNIVKQAISLYIATSTNLFHTNVDIDNESIEKRKQIEYNEEQIYFWIKHIYDQEIEWEKYFEKNSLSFLKFFYEDMINDIKWSLESILGFIGSGINYRLEIGDTIFHKVSTEKNEDYYLRFVNTEKNLKNMSSLGLNDNRWL